MRRGIWIAAFLVLVSTVGFSLSLVSVSKTSLWVEDGDTSVDVYFSLGENETTLPNSVIVSNGDWQILCSAPVQEGGNYKSTCSFDTGAPYGAYDVKLQCLNATNQTISQTYNDEFVVYRLSLTSTSIPTSVYSGDLLSVKVKFEKNGEAITVADNPPPEFSLYLDNNPMITYQPISIGNEINVTATVPSIAPGVYDLKIVGRYGTHEKILTLPKFVTVKSPLSFVLLGPSSVQKLSGEGTISISFSAKYRGEIISDISSSNLDIDVLNEDGDKVTSLVCDDPIFDASRGAYTANVIVPDLSYGEYYLKISLTYNGETLEADRYVVVQFVIPFEGAIVDPKGHGISTNINIKNDEIGLLKAVTNSNGEFSVNLIPGTYDITFTFPGMTALVQGVEIDTPIENPVRYDEFTPNVDIAGLHTAKLVVFELAVPFQEVVLHIPYDDAKVVDEQKLEVYTCHNWNFGRRSCAGEWERVPDPKIDTVRNVVTINMTSLSAFAVGERKSLYFSVDFPKDSFYMGEMFNVRGKVVDESGNPVKEAKVLYWFDEGEPYTVKTDEGGFFTITADAPEKEGGCVFHLRAEKEPFIPTEITQTLTVYKKSELSVRVPDTFAVTFDEPSSVNITVENTGQTDLSTITVSVEGLKSSWYVIYPSIIDSLSPGQKKEIEIRFKVPKTDCANEQCKTFYFVNVKAKSGETVGSGTITLKLSSLEEEPQAQPTQQATGFSISSALEFVKSPYFYTPVLIIIIIAVFVYLIKQKEKSRGGSSHTGRGYSLGGARTSTVDKIHAIKSKLVVKTEEDSHKRSRVSNSPFKFKYYRK